VLGEKGKLFYLKLYSVLPSIFIFGQKESCVLHFQTLEHLGDFGKSLDIGKLYTGPSQHQQCSTTPTGAGPRPCQRPAGTAHPTIFSSAPSARVVAHTDRGGSRTRRHWYYSDSATTVMATDGTMHPGVILIPSTQIFSSPVVPHRSAIAIGISARPLPLLPHVTAQRLRPPPGRSTARLRPPEELLEDPPPRATPRSDNRSAAASRALRPRPSASTTVDRSRQSTSDPAASSASFTPTAHTSPATQAPTSAAGPTPHRHHLRPTARHRGQPTLVSHSPP
jgi:hypothetical protein